MLYSIEYLIDKHGLIPCACGCRELIPARTKMNKPAMFKHGHNGLGENNGNFGKTFSNEIRKKLSKSHIGKGENEKNNKWKGDKVGNKALHRYVRRKKKPIPDLCEICQMSKPKDLANITGLYNRNLDNWKYLCHKCHMIYDRLVERYNL